MFEQFWNCATNSTVPSENTNTHCICRSTFTATSFCGCWIVKWRTYHFQCNAGRQSQQFLFKWEPIKNLAAFIASIIISIAIFLSAIRYYHLPLYFLLNTSFLSLLRILACLFTLLNCYIKHGDIKRLN